MIRTNLFRGLITAATIGATLSQANAQSSQDQARAYFFAADEAYQAGKYQDALKAVQRAESLSGETGPLLLKLEAQSLFKLGRYEEAKSTLNEFYASNPSASDQRDVASILLELDEKLEAAEELERQRREEDDRRDREYAAINPNDVGLKFAERVDQELGEMADRCLKNQGVALVSSSNRAQYPNGYWITTRYRAENTRVTDVGIYRPKKSRSYDVSMAFKTGDVKTNFNGSGWSSDSYNPQTQVESGFPINLRSDAVYIGRWKNLKFRYDAFGWSLYTGFQEKVKTEFTAKLKRAQSCFKSIEMTEVEKLAFKKNRQLFEDGFDGVKTSSQGTGNLSSFKIPASKNITSGKRRDCPPNTVFNPSQRTCELK